MIESPIFDHIIPGCRHDQDCVDESLAQYSGKDSYSGCKCISGCKPGFMYREHETGIKMRKDCLMNFRCRKQDDSCFCDNNVTDLKIITGMSQETICPRDWTAHPNTKVRDVCNLLYEAEINTFECNSMCMKIKCSIINYDSVSNICRIYDDSCTLKRVGLLSNFFQHKRYTCTNPYMSNDDAYETHLNVKNRPNFIKPIIKTYSEVIGGVISNVVGSGKDEKDALIGLNMDRLEMELVETR